MISGKQVRFQQNRVSRQRRVGILEVTKDDVSSWGTCGRKPVLYVTRSEIKNKGARNSVTRRLDEWYAFHPHELVERLLRLSGEDMSCRSLC